jgi:transcriptional regulator with XRE-family HTH domain
VEGSSESTQIMGIGARIRVRRRELRLTLQQLAKSTGLSTGFLSLVERGQTSPSLSSLTNIANAIDLPLGTLIDAPEPPHPDSHQESRQVFAVENGSVAYERLSTVFAGSKMHAVKILMPAGYASEAVSHAGEEFVFVLRGEIEYSINKKLYRLKVGDCVHFDAAKSHAVRSVGGDADVIWVGTLNVYDSAKKGREEGGQGKDMKEKAALFSGTEFDHQTIEFEN